MQCVQKAAVMRIATLCMAAEWCAKHRRATKGPSCLRVCQCSAHALQDDRINRAEILFPGVACFLIAAILGLFVHASNTDDVNAKLGIKRGHWLKNVTAKEAHEVPASKGTSLGRSGLPYTAAFTPIIMTSSQLRRVPR